jgi:hypothetical protein
MKHFQRLMEIFYAPSFPALKRLSIFSGLIF